MNFSPSAIVAGLLFGMLGGVLFREGKKRTSAELYFIAMAMMLYPYFVNDAFLCWAIGIILCVIAYQVLKKG